MLWLNREKGKGEFLLHTFLFQGGHAHYLFEKLVLKNVK